MDAETAKREVELAGISIANEIREERRCKEEDAEYRRYMRKFRLVTCPKCKEDTPVRLGIDRQCWECGYLYQDGEPVIAEEADMPDHKDVTEKVAEIKGIIDTEGMWAGVIAAFTAILRELAELRQQVQPVEKTDASEVEHTERVPRGEESRRYIAGTAVVSPDGQHITITPDTPGRLRNGETVTMYLDNKQAEGENANG